MTRVSRPYLIHHVLCFQTHTLLITPKMYETITMHKVGSNYYSPCFCLREEGEDCDPLAHFYESSGLTVSEDRQYIYVEASLPGIQSDEIEMVFEYGTLWITAKRKNAIRFKRKFYSQALSHFSYRVAIPVDVEEKPKRVRCKNGILKLVFVKKKKIFSKASSL